VAWPGWLPACCMTRPHTLTVAGAAQEWADQELPGHASLTLLMQCSVSAVTCFPFHQGAGYAPSGTCNERRYCSGWTIRCCAFVRITNLH
jgi:hypothetical protein